MPSSIKLIRGIAELRSWRASVSGRVGFVPTMGALHAGHAELLSRVRPACDVSVLSVFVNPAQFGPREDFAKYPRALERDLELAAAQDVDVVFAPSPQEMYPAGFSTYVEETRLSAPLCGRFRPGHFRGVTTVVLKLLSLVRPHLALFGLKDAQQFFVLRKLAEDLGLETSIEAIPTVRETDGLALSSRNAYLGADERARAPRLYEALRRAAGSIEAGDAPGPALAAAANALAAAGFDVQYLECVSIPDLEPIDSVGRDRSALVAAAACLGDTRLIDNVIVHPPGLEELGIRIRS